jgi:hypothetical protein
MFNQQSSPGSGQPNPELLHKFLEAACQGQFGPQAKQMAEAAQGQSSAPAAPQDGQQQPQGPPQDGQGQQPPQPGRTLPSKHIFGRPGMGAPQGNDQDDDDQQQAPMGARGIFGR